MMIVCDDISFVLGDRERFFSFDYSANYLWFRYASITRSAIGHSVIAVMANND